MGISDILNNLISDWTGVVKGIAGLAALALVVITAIVTRGSWAKILISMAVGAFVVWGVTMNGLGWFSDGINGELTTAPATLVVTESTPVV